MRNGWRRKDPRSTRFGPKTPIGTPLDDGDAETKTPADPFRPLKPAKHKVMDYLARRNHSVLELQQKLGRDYPPDEVDAAIRYAQENNWMLPPDELSEMVARSLGRKAKGHRFINQFLKTKGLPAVSKDGDDEVVKGRKLVAAKMGFEFLEPGERGPLEFSEERKIYRLLANRGFDDESIRKVIASFRQDFKSGLGPEQRK